MLLWRDIKRKGCFSFRRSAIRDILSIYFHTLHVEWRSRRFCLLLWRKQNVKICVKWLFSYWFAGDLWNGSVRFWVSLNLFNMKRLWRFIYFFIFFPYVQRCSGSLAVCFYLKSVFLAPVRSVICTLGKKLFIKLPTPQERGLIERHSSKMETSSRPILRAGPSCEITFTLAVMSRTGSPVGSWTERSCEKTHESLQTSCRRPVESRSVSRQWWTQHQLSHC